MLAALWPPIVTWRRIIIRLVGENVARKLASVAIWSLRLELRVWSLCSELAGKEASFSTFPPAAARLWL